jgi:isoleucyl-tRNA synthetase
VDGDKIKSPSSPEDFAVFLSPASGSKCARCWNFMPHVSNYGVWENVCDRCQAALQEMNIAPPQPEAAA